MTPEAALAGMLITAGVLVGRATLQGKVRRLERQQITDALTGLVNRLGLTQHLNARTGARSPYALLLLDLDGFKLVNDAHGHRAGDALLTVIGSRLRSLQPGSGIAARLGGDEFVVVAGVHTDVPALTYRIVRDLSEPVTVRLDGADRTVQVGASVGVAYGAVGTPFRQVLHAADAAMYDAKRTRSHIAYATGARHWLTDAPTLRHRDIRRGQHELPAAARACVLDLQPQLN